MATAPTDPDGVLRQEAFGRARHAADPDPRNRTDPCPSVSPSAFGEPDQGSGAGPPRHRRSRDCRIMMIWILSVPVPIIRTCWRHAAGRLCAGNVGSAANGTPLPAFRLGRCLPAPRGVRIERTAAPSSLPLAPPTGCDPSGELHPAATGCGAPSACRPPHSICCWHCETCGLAWLEPAGVDCGRRRPADRHPGIVPAAGELAAGCFLPGKPVAATCALADHLFGPGLSPSSPEPGAAPAVLFHARTVLALPVGAHCPATEPL